MQALMGLVYQALVLHEKATFIVWAFFYSRYVAVLYTCYGAKELSTIFEALSWTRPIKTEGIAV